MAAHLGQLLDMLKTCKAGGIAAAALVTGVDKNGRQHAQQQRQQQGRKTASAMANLLSAYSSWCAPVKLGVTSVSHH
jgi:hypothetical protein